MKMDWCVASRSAAGEAKHWDIREFLDIPEVQSVRELEAHGERGRYLLATTDGQAAAVKVEVPARVGCQVQRRSADWTWGDQDGGPGKFGKLLGDDSTSPGWVRVQWDNGATNTCRAGAEGKWDLDYVDAGAETKKYLLLSLSLLTRLRGPTVKSPPMQLNFFELLRSSLGDPQFQDVWLIPEAPHFHEVALGLDRQKEIRPPASLARILRPYQVSGFQWLAALARNGLGAILADDMGLGKTIQAITMLVHLYDNGLLADEAGVRRPGLVVVPPGLLRNWQQEFQQWAPQLEIYLYHGPKRELPRSSVDVMLTTYHMVRNDVSTLCDRARITFSCMVIDEAQCIKNHGTKLTKAVKEVGNCIGHTRIALSGTPIENKVDELHSLFDFTMYGYLGDQHRFSREFSKVIEQGRNPAKRQEVLALLKTLTSPFQMRRLKTDPSIRVGAFCLICPRRSISCRRWR
ncbi:unnamed protein product [Prorocentrum cordatum]|uniref:Helicase ATP-binding domain-containing protein n=1 Tax=Prorocentrum cordatum TaxID=2364126 RepID=A0ABN9Q7Y2_9DINO|nr:unnamed protein product [Polarella glacialis]